MSAILTETTDECGCALGHGRCPAYDQMARALGEAQELDQMHGLATLMNGHLTRAFANTKGATVVDAALNYMLAFQGGEGPSILARARDLERAVTDMLTAVEQNQVTYAVRHARRLRHIAGGNA